MSNTWLTPTMVTKRSLPLFLNSNALIKNIDRQYSDQFAQAGAKIGTTTNIRLPVRLHRDERAEPQPAEHRSDQHAPDRDQPGACGHRDHVS